MTAEISDYQKHRVLFVDDEEKTRKYFKRLFGESFDILLASDGVEALEVLQKNLDTVGLIVTDQRMPNETGTAFLEKAVKLKPGLVRILSTAYADIEAAIDAVNKGGVYRYITKPWDVADLEVTLKRAMEFYLLQRERDELVRQKVSGIETIAISDRILSLAALAATRESKLCNVSDALASLARIFGAGQVRQGNWQSAVEPNGWTDLYRQNQRFLSRAISQMPQGMANSARLSMDGAVGISDVLQSATAGDARLVTSPSSHAGVWPGPVADTQKVFKGLLIAFKSVLNATDVIRLQETTSGVECQMPCGALCHALAPLFGSTNEEPSGACLDLVAEFLRFFHLGGSVDTFPQADAMTVKLRIGFVASRLGQNPGDALESVAGDLIGNELFWARNLE
jgi:FixJ family two-component response regulator